MITRDELRYLAQIENTHNSAVSFYLQPSTPQDRSHREDLILVKDMVRDALRHAERSGGNGKVKEDLHRIQEKAEQWKGGSKAKVVFACSAQNIWRAFDVPPRLARSQLIVNDRFHLKPLARLVEAFPRTAVLLFDRERARFFTIRGGEIDASGEIFNPLPRKVRSDGFAGYNAGHIERHIENESMKHMKEIADRLRELQQNGGCERFLIGCREEAWPELEPHLHPYVKQRLVGRFVIDPALASREQVLQEANRLLDHHDESERHAIVREVVGESQRNGRGVVGLRHVLQSLEKGEIQALLVGENFSATASRCANCGHMDTRMVRHCAVCNSDTREIDDVGDALVGFAIKNGIQVVYVGEDPGLERAGNVGALLRFRADQNTMQKKMAS